MRWLAVPRETTRKRPRAAKEVPTQTKEVLADERGLERLELVLCVVY
jgi:hypothetical protein